MTILVPMKMNSEKVHSVRYDAIDKDAAITSVYVMKKALQQPYPQNIAISIVYNKE